MPQRARKCPPVEVRFWAKVVRLTDEECWEWQGHRCKKGYGTFRDGKMWKAHRWSYTQIVGPIPKGKVLDHRCRNRGCVNPKHLRPLTGPENMEHRDPVNATGKSRYLGVTYHQATGKWAARVTIKGQRRYLGLYETEEVAAEICRQERAKHLTYNDWDRREKISTS